MDHIQLFGSAIDNCHSVTKITRRRNGICDFAIPKNHDLYVVHEGETSGRL